jgi:hypothetical protein
VHRKRLTRKDLLHSDVEFLLGKIAPDVSDRLRMKEILETDMDFRNAFLTEDKLLWSLMSDDETLVRLSPAMFFEILLRNAAKQMGRRSYTLEKVGTLMTIPVFDGDEMLAVLRDEDVLMYLAHMLATFTRLESYTYTFRVGPAVWREIRFNDLDLESLLKFVGAVDEEYRLGLYKRIGDVCLFLLGIFHDFTAAEHHYPSSKERRPALLGRPRLAASEYESRGSRFYRKAAEHRDAADLELEAVFWKLHANFEKLCKPLTFIADNYLYQKMHLIF